MRDKRRWCGLLLSAMMLSVSMSSVPVEASSFSLSNSKVTINVGDTIDLDANGAENEPRWVSWNVNTAKVDKNGVVTGVRTGKTTVSARVGLDLEKCSVTIVNPKLKLNKTSATIFTGGTSKNTVQLKATVSGATKNVEWFSSDESVAKVSSTGLVTSVGSGTAVITAKSNGLESECNITVKTSDIKLNTESLTLSTKGAGSSIKLVPTIVGSSNSVKWATSDKSVATVSNGKVTGKNTGTATITATANGVSTTCNVTVTKGMTSISEERVDAYSGETIQLKSNAAKTDTVQWFSSDESVLTVDSNGKVTAVGEGTAVVSITCNGNDVVDTCTFNVRNITTDIGQDSIELMTKGNNTFTLTSQVVGRNSKIKWATSDSKIATVKNGKVTAKKAGTVTITASANGVSDTCTVLVEEYHPSIKINQDEYTLYTTKGNSVTLKATVDGKNKKVNWGSSDPSIATVNNKGKVTAHKEGLVLITAGANGVTDDCVINVRTSEVELELCAIHMEKGDKVDLPVDVTGASQTSTYKSTNTKVATVKNGVVTAKNYGAAQVKVTANGVTSVCNVYVDDCVHEFDDGEITVDATCYSVGTKLFSCTKCDHSYEDSVPMIEHDFEDFLTYDASCTNKGFKSFKCRNCDKTNTEILDYTGHVFGDWIVCTHPTEFSNGLSKRYCINCNAIDIKSTTKLDHEHSYEKVVVEPTCTENGHTDNVCACGDSYKTDEVNALGHAWSEWVTTKVPTTTEIGEQTRNCSRCEATETKELAKVDHEHVYTDSIVEPTCTEKGYTTYTCSCGETYNDTFVDELGHDWSEWSTVTKPTEATEGKQTRTCNRCNETEAKTLPTTDHVHNYNSVVTQPTCLEEGYTTYTCSCKDSYVDAKVDALGHDWSEWSTTKEATETEVGEQERECSRCNEKETKELSKIDHEHSYKFEVTDATCTTEGYTTHTCACGDSYVDAKVDALGHDFSDWVVTVEPTEDTTGTKTRECSRCDETETETIPELVHEHNYNETVVESTCSEQGYTDYECKCGDTFRGNYTDALGHSFDSDFVTDKEPTCSATGSKSRHCTRTGCEDKSDVTVIDKLAHEYGEFTNTVNPTCTLEGSKEKVCRNCSDKITETVGALGHDWSAWGTTVEPTEETTGTKERTCSRCNEVETDTIPTLEHVCSYNSEVVRATCTEKGYTKYTCRCGDTYEDDYMNALGHDYSNWSVAKASTCESTGVETHDCRRCGNVENRDIAVLGHSYSSSYTVDTAATCTTTGSKSKHCTRNGCTSKTDVTSIAATGHASFTDASWVWDGYTKCTGTGKCTKCGGTASYDAVHISNKVTKEPTCTQTGIRTYTATITMNGLDGATKTEVIPATGHSYGSYTTTKEATCNAEGSKKRTCSKCSNVETATITSLGHNYSSSYTVDKAATCTTTGSKSKHCTRSGCTSKTGVTSIAATGHSTSHPIVCSTCNAYRVTVTEPGLYRVYEPAPGAGKVLSKVTDWSTMKAVHGTNFSNNAYNESAITSGSDSLYSLIKSEKLVSSKNWFALIIPEGETIGYNRLHAVINGSMGLKYVIAPSSMSYLRNSDGKGNATYFGSSASIVEVYLK